jgi:hypothetical protein
MAPEGEIEGKLLICGNGRKLHDIPYGKNFRDLPESHRDLESLELFEDSSQQFFLHPEKRFIILQTGIELRRNRENISDVLVVYQGPKDVSGLSDLFRYLGRDLETLSKHSKSAFSGYSNTSKFIDDIIGVEPVKPGFDLEKLREKAQSQKVNLDADNIGEAVALLKFLTKRYPGFTYSVGVKRAGNLSGRIHINLK